MQRPSDFVPRGSLKKVVGSATVPVTGGLRYIIYAVNNQGTTDLSEFSKRWPNAVSDYRQWYRNSFGKMKLGTIKTLQVQSDTALIAALVYDGDRLDLNAVGKALDLIGQEVSYNNGNAHIKKFAAGDDWEKVEEAIVAQLSKRSINVTVYGRD